MRENLVGYLLRAIEPEEHAAVEQHLEKDPALRNDCELLRACLTPLEDDKEHHAPPQGLSQRACQFVYSRTEVMPAALTSPGDTGRAVTRRSWSWLDLSVAGAIAVAVAVLFVPAIYQSRTVALRNACQKNLQEIGAAMASYSDRHDGYYPVAHPDDQVNSPGMWAPKLVSHSSFPRGDETLICPVASLPAGAKFHVPTLAEIDAMSPAQRAQVRSKLSGSYGATLGYREGGKYQPQRKGHQTQFPLASDKGGKDATNSPNHGGEGQYVLFDNGSVKYITQPHVGDPVNNFFLNNNGKPEAGTNAEDSVIADSAAEIR